MSTLSFQVWENYINQQNTSSLIVNIFWCAVSVSSELISNYLVSGNVKWMNGNTNRRRTGGISKVLAGFHYTFFVEHGRLRFSFSIYSSAPSSENKVATLTDYWPKTAFYDIPFNITYELVGCRILDYWDWQLSTICIYSFSPTWRVTLFKTHRCTITILGSPLPPAIRYAS